MKTKTTSKKEPFVPIERVQVMVHPALVADFRKKRRAFSDATEGATPAEMADALGACHTAALVLANEISEAYTVAGFDALRSPTSISIEIPSTVIPEGKTVDIYLNANRYLIEITRITFDACVGLIVEDLRVGTASYLEHPVRAAFFGRESTHPLRTRSITVAGKKFMMRVENASGAPVEFTGEIEAWAR